MVAKFTFHQETFCVLYLFLVQSNLMYATVIVTLPSWCFGSFETTGPLFLFTNETLHLPYYILIATALNVPFLRSLRALTDLKYLVCNNKIDCIDILDSGSGQDYKDQNNIFLEIVHV